MTVTERSNPAVDYQYIGLRPLVQYNLELPVPVGVNHQDNIGRGPKGKPNRYLTPREVTWRQEGMILLRLAGVRELPPGEYDVFVSYDLYSSDHDVDSCCKTLLDLIAKALGINDRRVVQVTEQRYDCPKGERSLEVSIVVYPARDRMRKKVPL